MSTAPAHSLDDPEGFMFEAEDDDMHTFQYNDHSEPQGPPDDYGGMSFDSD